MFCLVRLSIYVGDGRWTAMTVLSAFMSTKQFRKNISDFDAPFFWQKKLYLQKETMCRPKLPERYVQLVFTTKHILDFFSLLHSPLRSMLLIEASSPCSRARQLVMWHWSFQLSSLSMWRAAKNYFLNFTQSAFKCSIQKISITQIFLFSSDWLQNYLRAKMKKVWH